MKYFFFSLFAALILSTTLTNAQNSASNWQIGFGVSPGGATSNPFKYTLGGDIRVQKNFNNRISGTLTAGFTHFFEKDHFDGYNQYGSPYNVIPVKAGVKVFLTDGFYLGGEAGVGFGFEQWGNSFVWSPSVGVAFKNGIDLSIRYEDFTKNKVTQDVALRLAYGINTKRLTVHKREELPEGWQLGVSVNPGVTSSSGSATLGGEVGLYKHLTNNLEATLSVGYTHFFDVYNNYFFNESASYNITNITKTTQNVLPVEAGLRLYAGNQFYIGGSAGVAFPSHGNAGFVYSPSMGLTFKSGLDIGVKYEKYASDNTTDLVALKLGYRFKL